MFFCLATFISSKSYDERYSLVPPLEQSDVYEFGNWTIRGTAISLKKSMIRLSSGIDQDFGTICQRVPTLFKDWVVELELKVTGKSTDANTIQFIFSQELCPEIPIQWNGFLLWINTTIKSPEQTDSNILLFPNDGLTIMNTSLAINAGHFKLRNQEHPTILRITRLGDHIAGFVKTPEGNYDQLFEATIPNLVDYGYFTVTGFSSTSGDVQDLYSFITYPSGKYDRPEFTEDIEKENRKVLEMAAKERRILKRERRKHMPTMLKILNEMEDHLNLDGNKGQFNLKDSLNVIQEMFFRANSSITSKELKLFISHKLIPILKKMQERTVIQNNSLDELKEKVNSLWGYLRSQMRDMGMSSKLSMETIQKEMIERSKIVVLKPPDRKSLEKQVESQDLSIPRIQYILNIIMICEFVAYIIFLIIKRQKVHMD